MSNKDFKEKPSQPSKPNWDPNFAPSYTPKEMLEMGVFEGKYINVVDGLPKGWYKIKKVLKTSDQPDVSINYYGIKSRQPLDVWRKNGWTATNSPYGWFEWYCLYFCGRRLDKEDEWQINRWRSFVARHSGQVMIKCKPGDKSCHTKQRQALLQWGWNSDKPFNDRQTKINLDRLAKMQGINLNVGNESHIVIPASGRW